jgi:hypothetical protein
MEHGSNVNAPHGIAGESRAAASAASRTLLVISAALLLLVGIAAWVAGTRYERLRTQQLVSQLANAQENVVRLRMQLRERDARIQESNNSPRTSGSESVAVETERMRRQILRLQAELNAVQNVSNRDREELADKQQLVNALSGAGAHLIALRGQETALPSVAYAIVIENQKLLLIASKLPKAPAGHDYQLWVLRKEEPATVSGGVFSPDDDGRVMFQLTESQLVSHFAALSVTLEPVGGSDAPAGPKIYSSVEP